MPIPPIWISTRMTACPSHEKSLPVDRTARPVTQVALVAVNRASRKEIALAPDARQKGRVSSTAPRKMTTAYHAKEARAGYLRSDPVTSVMPHQAFSHPVCLPFSAAGKTVILQP